MVQKMMLALRRPILVWVVLAGLMAAGVFVRSQAATSDCPDISTLPCESVKFTTSRTFDFTGTDGGLTDQNGVGLGFVMVDPPSHPGNPSPNPVAPGYWPANLLVANGRLKITASPGTALTSSNSQDNALGIGLDLGNPLIIQTNLVNLPAAPGGEAQAGLWFGKAGIGPSGLGGTGTSEDNYAKLAVVSPAGASTWRVQMMWEQDGTVVQTVNSPNLTGAPPVALYLAIDPSLHTVTGRYCVTAGCDPSLAPVFTTFSTIPAEWYSADQAGIDLNVGTRSMAGIFSSRGSAGSAVSFEFENFIYATGAGTAKVASQDGVDFSTWSITGIRKPTALAFGPDGRLYAADVTGNIYAYTLDFATHQATAVQTITAVQNRLALGLTVDPASTPSQVILWVAHSDVSQGNGKANSGTISKLTGPTFSRVDVITGLPRAIANHATNNLHFGADGKLYIAQGGNTGAGASNNAQTEFSTRPEQPLSAAILVADVKAANFDGTCTSLIDPNGTQMDATGVAATDHPCDVQVYASGLRNPYDFTFHPNGQMYATENGLGVIGTFPQLQPDPLSWSPSSGCVGMVTGSANITATNPGSRPDLLQRIVQGGYYGHPNPTRNECVFFGANPTSSGDFPVPYFTSDQTKTDLMQATKYPVGMQPDPNWRQPMFDFGPSKSANGIIAYASNNQAFCGRMDGDLLVTYFSQTDQVRRLHLTANGQGVAWDKTLIRTNPASGGSLMVDPLPITQDSAGRVYVGEFSNNQITVLDPIQVGFWETTYPASLPVALLDAGSGVINGKLYAVAGKTSASHVKTLYVYEPSSNLWSQLADMPVDFPAVENPAVAVYNGKLYVFGGSTQPFSGAVAKSAVYDPASSQWTMLADMPTARGGVTAQAIGTKIYVVGGMNSSGNSLATLEIYDVASNTWSAGPNMSTLRDNPGSAAMNGKLYVFGGRTRLNGVEVQPTLSSMEIYTPGQGWTTGSPMPTGRRTMVVTVMNGEAILMGGEKQPDGSAFRANEAYNPVTGRWRVLTDMPVGRHGAVAGVIGKAIYVAGGGITGGTSFTADADAFYFDCDVTFPPSATADLTLNKYHNGDFNQGQNGAQYTLSVTNQGGGATSGTVTVQDTLPAGLTATDLSGAGWTCTLASLTCTRSDVLAAGALYPPITLTVNVATNLPNQVTNTATVSGGGDTNTGNNSASDLTNLVQAADLVLSKTHSGDFSQGQAGAVYLLTVTNNGVGPSQGAVSVTDALPAGLAATDISGSGWACNLASLSCTRSDVLAAGSSYPVIILTVNVDGNAPVQVTNTATVTGGGDANSANNTANDLTSVVQLPDLTLTKTHSGDFTQGQSGAKYSLAVQNAGAGPTSGSVTVQDSLPAGLTATDISGTGWTCTLASLSCTRSNALAAGGSYPAINLTVTVAGNAPAQVTNTASVTGGGDTSPANNSASDPTTIVQVPDLVLEKTHTGIFQRGQVGAQYALKVTNIGDGPTSGAVTVADTLPGGLTATAIGGSGWTCDLGSLTCTRSDGLGAAASYPDITLTVNVAANAQDVLANTASVLGGGELNSANNSAADNVTLAQAPDLVIDKTHLGDFVQGQAGAVYTLLVRNAGPGASSGTVTVTDALPAGLTASAASGDGWNCSLPSGSTPLTCTRADSLASAASYPAIQVTVTVAADASIEVTNTASVSGGGELDPANNSSSDLTHIVPHDVVRRWYFPAMYR